MLMNIGRIRVTDADDKNSTKKVYKKGVSGLYKVSWACTGKGIINFNVDLATRQFIVCPVLPYNLRNFV